MKAPIEVLLDQIDWIPLEGDKPEGDEPEGETPYATHSGILDVMGLKLRVYQLSNGKRVIAGEDLIAFFEGGSPSD